MQLKAVRLIKAADVIMYDDLGAEVSQYSPAVTTHITDLIMSITA